jgi:GTP-binding protein HflX
VSARTGEGLEELMEAVGRELPRPSVRVDLVVPYTRGDLLNEVHDHGEVLSQEHGGDGTVLSALVDESLAARLHEAAAAATAS